MNYFTGQVLATLMTTIVIVLMLTVIVIFLVGGTSGTGADAVTSEGIMSLIGQNLTRGG